MSKQVNVQMRGDGLHVFWFDVSKGNSVERRHEIVLKLDAEALLRDGAPALDARVAVRVRAFAATMVVGGNPKNVQKSREKTFSSGEAVEQDGDLDPVVDEVVSAIRQELKRMDDSKLEMTRRSLRTAVMDAHKLLPYDEVDSIVRNALAEHVTSS